MELQDRSRVLEILGLCEAKNIDYCDASLMVEARREDLPIVSYDRDFAKAPEVAAVSPIEWVKDHPPK
jgi:predicted nucleic acid-binding protein